MWTLNIRQIASDCKKFDKIIIANFSSSSSVATRISNFLQQQFNSSILDISSSAPSSNKTGLLVCASNDEFHIAIALLISLSKTTITTNLKLGLCELVITISGDRRSSSDTNNNNNKNIFQEILSIQLVADPIFSPSLFEHDERDFFRNITKISLSANPKEEAAFMNIIFNFAKTEEKEATKQALQSFFSSNINNNKGPNIERKIQVWKTFSMTTSELHDSPQQQQKQRNEEDPDGQRSLLLSRFSDLISVIIANRQIRKTSNTTGSQNNNNHYQQQQHLLDAVDVQKQKLMTERKWSLWVSQRLENNKKQELERASEQDDKDEELRFQSCAKNLAQMFSGSSSHNHFEKLIKETTQVMLEQRRGRSGTSAAVGGIENSKSPFGRFFSSSPPSSNNEYQSQITSNNNNTHQGSTTITISSANNNRFDNSDDNSSNSNYFDDETEAILKALTEKKKSLTLVKRAEDWFAALSARGVPTPLKQLAMAMPYHWRFWLTPMGFLVIGSCFMMFFGIVLLIV